MQTILPYFKILLNNLPNLASLAFENPPDIFSQSVFSDFSVAGFQYDPEQDIFYSKQNPWQRRFGYCTLYDELSAGIALIYHCEPVIFTYGDKEWRIELWKGQYGMTTGAEIGVYVLEASETESTPFTFYRSANDEERLQMRFKLYKDGNLLLSRSDLHWWLTGFKLGEFSQPEDLVLDVSITFPEAKMALTFADALTRIGYREYEITVDGETVSFIFDKPRSPQPLSQSSLTAHYMQFQNRTFCKLYKDLTGLIDSPAEKLIALRNARPEIFRKVVNISGSKRFYKLLSEPSVQNILKEILF